MNFTEMYKEAVRLGMEADPRGREAPQKTLQENKNKYEGSSEKDKEFFDTEGLENPYPDTRILYRPEEDPDIKKIIAGIDIDAGELQVAKAMQDIDAVFSHHPRGKALASLGEVMPMQAEILNMYGVPINVAEALLEKRISEVSRGLSPGNHFRSVDIARLLHMPFACTHTVTDNMAYQFLKKEVEDKEPEKVGDIFDMLLDVPEYKKAENMGLGPKLFSGKKENRAGKIAVTEVTGGTEGAKDIYEKMANAGVGTIIAMHQSEQHRENAEKAHINVIISGHMSSDSMGMNQLLDYYERNGIGVVPAGGLIRVSRN